MVRPSKAKTAVNLGAACIFAMSTALSCATPAFADEAKPADQNSVEVIIDNGTATAQSNHASENAASGMGDEAVNPDVVDKSVQDQLGELVRPEQSGNVETHIGQTTPDGESNSALHPEIDPGSDKYFDIVFDEEKGVFRVTYEIQDNWDGREFDGVEFDENGIPVGPTNQEVTIDLTDAKRALSRWAQEQGRPDYSNLQPGDVVPFEIFFTSKSGHTYAYKDGSFILATPSMDRIASSEDAKDKDITAFDGQTILDRFSNLEVKMMGTDSDAMQNLLKDAGATPERNFSVSVSEYQKIIQFLKGKYGSEESTGALLERYLLDFYRGNEKYGISEDEEITDLKSLAAKHMSVMQDLYVTGSNTYFGVDVGTVSSAHTDAIVAKTESCSTGVEALKYYLEGVYREAGKTETQIANMKSATSYSSIRNQVRNAFVSSDPVYKLFTGGNYSDLIRLYDYVNGAGAANQALIDSLGVDGPIKTYDASGKETSDPAQVKWIRIVNHFEPSTLYDNFYNNVISVQYGEEKIKELVPNIEKIYTNRADKDFYMAHGVSSSDFDYYVWLMDRGVVPPEDLYDIYRDPLNNEVGTLITLSSPCEKDEDGNPYVLDENGEIVYLEKVDKYFTHLEPKNEDGSRADSWESANDAGITVGDYMVSMLNKTGKWAEANEYFHQLLAGGISSDEATWVAFQMAVNADGENAGNGYQDTQWTWYNSIKLERVDGEFHLTKVDADNKANVLGDEEGETDSSFYLWYKEDVDVDNDGSLDSFYYTKDANGNVGFVKYDGKNKELSYTISTSGGKLDIDYAMLESIIYYLQEAVAPEGYDVDTNIYIICNQESYESLLDGKESVEITNVANSKTATGVWVGAGIDSEKPLNLTFVNSEANGTSPVVPDDDVPGDEGDQPGDEGEDPADKTETVPADYVPRHAFNLPDTGHPLMAMVELALAGAATVFGGGAVGAAGKRGKYKGKHVKA